MEAQLSSTIGGGDPQQIITHAAWTRKGIYAFFADGKRVDVPAADVVNGRTSTPTAVQVVPFGIDVYFGRAKEHLPWDWLRSFCDPEYRARSAASADQSRVVLGQRLRTLRDSVQMTQEQVAAKAGISRVTLSRMENGQNGPTLDTLGKIARAMGFTLMDTLSP